MFDLSFQDPAVTKPTGHVMDVNGGWVELRSYEQSRLYFAIDAEGEIIGASRSMSIAIMMLNAETDDVR